MKTLGSLLNRSNIESRHATIDQESIFYIFGSVVKTEYGRLGSENIMPVLLKDRKIFIKTKTATWADEILQNKEYILQKVNEQLGGKEIADLAMSS